MIETPTVFKWRHFQGEIIVRCLRWHLCYIKVKGEWLYQGRTVDSSGQTIAFIFYPEPFLAANTEA